MWDLPGPGLTPVSPALAGGLPTTAPPGKPLYCMFILYFVYPFIHPWTPGVLPPFGYRE